MNKNICRTCGKARYRWSPRRKNRKKCIYCSDLCQQESTFDRVSILPSVRAAVLERDNYRCRYCGASAEVLDHVIPYSKGGSNQADNLVACCSGCNSIVHDRLFNSFEEKREWITADAPH